MKQLPNGLTVFNGTPHPIRFWDVAWDGPVEVAPDRKIDARAVEEETGFLTREELGLADDDDHVEVIFVRTKFVPTREGCETIRRAQRAGANVIVGSIIAAQAYPGQVVAMTPCTGYERVSPAEKRMNPDKFTMF